MAKRAQRKNIKKYKTTKILDYFGVAFLSLLLLFIWQLYKGPIAVPFLKPYIIQALSTEDETYQVSLESVNIELVRSIQPIKIIAKNIVYKKEDDSFIINAPRTSVSFSIRALLRGIIAPSSIEVEAPSIYAFTSYGIEKNKTEEINKKKIEYYINMAEDFLEKYNNDDKYAVENYINTIEIKNANVEFHEVDLGRKWVLTDANYSYERRHGGLHTEASALIDINNKIASAGIECALDTQTKNMGLKVYFSDIVPADIMNNFVEKKKQKELYQINLPLSGSLSGNIALGNLLKHKDNMIEGLDEAIKSIDFGLEGGQGSINFTEDKKMRYDVSSFKLDGEIKGKLDELSINNAKFDLDGQEARLSLKIKGLKKYTLENSLKDIKASMTAKIKKLKLDDLTKYWPRYLGESGWIWCKESLFDGEAKNAEFQFDFAYDNKAKSVVFKDLTGQVEAENATILYLTGMPVIKNSYGLAKFTKDSIDIEIDKAISEGVILNGGYVKLYDLDKEDNYADIKLVAESTITDVLKLIDNPPLNFVKEMGIPAEKLKGNAQTDLSLNFELKDDLKPEEVKVDVKARLSDVTINKVIEDKNLTAEELNLEVNNNNLTLSGKANFDEIPLELVWKENFHQKTNKSQYEILFKLDDKIKQKLGIDIDILNPPYIEGYAMIKSTIDMSDKKEAKIAIDADIRHAAIDYSFLGFRKLYGEEGTITAEVILNEDKISSIPSFALIKPDFKLDGSITLSKDGQLEKANISHIRGPKTNARAKIEWTGDKNNPLIKINVSGNSYDLSTFFDRRAEQEQEAYARQQEKKNADATDNDWENITSADINIAVNKLWTNPKVPITNFAGAAKLRHGIGVHEVHMVGNYGDSKEVKLKADYSPRPNNEYYLSISSNNAGSTFKVLRIYDNISGGNLKIEGKRDAQKEFVGHASIRDFNLHNTPVLAKVLSVASLTGIVGMLSGEGIAFSHLDAPFEYKNKVLTVEDGKAFGNVLGITMNGSYNWNTEEIKGKGVIAPAYSINSFLGKIPLVGSLLAGKDGTVFAANYSVKGNIADAEVDINPLSALSPGSLKDLFSSMFGSENGNN